MPQQPILAEQQAVLRRISKLAQWAKRDFRYRGRLLSDDIASAAVEKLVRRHTYNRALHTQPMKLWNLLRLVVRHALIELVKKERLAEVPLEGAPLPGVAPSVLRELERYQCATAGQAVLARALVDDGPGRIGPARRRAQMVEAFTLRWHGKSHRAIGLQLGVSKATVGNWIADVKRYVVDGLSDAEADMLPFDVDVTRRADPKLRRQRSHDRPRHETSSSAH